MLRAPNQPPYTAYISRIQPACLLFLLDQSAYMREPFAAEMNGTRKCDVAAQEVNNWMRNLIIMASKCEGVQDWFHVGVIGYRTDNRFAPVVKPLLPGPNSGNDLVPVSAVWQHPLRQMDTIQTVLDEDNGELCEVPVQTPVWLDAVSEGRTPLCHALRRAHQILSGWVGIHQNCFPPLVINITSGRSQDGDPAEDAGRLRALSTEDGNLLLINLYLSSNRQRSLFASDNEARTDEFARKLVETSSALPDNWRNRLRTEGFSELAPDSKCTVINASIPWHPLLCGNCGT